MAMMMRRLHHLWCRLTTGHDHGLLHFEPQRLAMTCERCGWTSPGWRLEPERVEPKPSSAVSRWLMKPLSN